MLKNEYLHKCCALSPFDIFLIPLKDVILPTDSELFKSSMHELSIAGNILEIVEETARIHNFTEVEEVDIEIGVMSGVVKEVLEFSFEIVVKGTILEKSKININEIHAEAQCNNCGKVFNPEDIYTQCPGCGSTSYDIIKGRELRVKSIKV